MAHKAFRHAEFRIVVSQPEVNGRRAANGYKSADVSFSHTDFHIHRVEGVELLMCDDSSTVSTMTTVTFGCLPTLPPCSSKSTGPLQLFFSLTFMSLY